MESTTGCSLFSTYNGSELSISHSRMDSIDVYLEKKRKRMEMFNQSAKKAKVKSKKKRLSHFAHLFDDF